MPFLLINKPEKAFLGSLFSNNLQVCRIVIHTTGHILLR